MFSNLGKECRVIGIDQRGFGKSDKPIDRPYSTEMWADDLSKFLRALNIGRTVVAGHSMGGRIACHFAAKYPRQTAGLVVMDSTMWGSNPAGATELRSGVTRVVAEGMKVFANTPWSRSLDARHRRISKLVTRETMANNPRAYALAAEIVAADMAGETDYSFLGKIDCPTLIIVGDRDSAPLEGALAMRRMIHGASLGVIPDCGHFSTLEKPDVLGSMLSDFIARTER
jgi:pimeloyl-ACP methyl ester carboxylesterase